MIKTGTNLYFAEVLKLPSGAGKQTLYKGKKKKAAAAAQKQQL